MSEPVSAIHFAPDTDEIYTGLKNLVKQPLHTLRRDKMEENLRYFEQHCARSKQLTDAAIERTLRALWSRPELNNAVLACESGHPWFRRLIELACQQDPSIRFALGPALVNRAWRDPGNAPLPQRLGPEAFYQFPPSQTSRYFRGGILPSQALVLHWCSSNHKSLLPLLGPDWIARHASSSPWAASAVPLMESIA